MIVRVLVKNLFSFQGEVEFNTLPGQGTRLKSHKYKAGDKELLKLSVIYGANGSGKSNFIKAVSMLRQLVVVGNIPRELWQQKFKLSVSNMDLPAELGIEFCYKGVFYFYSVAIDDAKIVDEYLCTIEGKANSDKVVFHRKTSKEGTSIIFNEEYDKNDEFVLLKRIIEKDLIKPNRSLIHLLKGLSNEKLAFAWDAYRWFDDYLTIIFPETTVNPLAILLDEDKRLWSFTHTTIRSFGTGIVEIGLEERSLSDYMGENEKIKVEEMEAKLADNPDSIIEITNEFTGEKVHAEYVNGKAIVKRLFFEHQGVDDQPVSFDMVEESDGTRRLIEYIPALFDLIHEDRTYLIDEIERSIHPVMIKEILAKFSMDANTKGQLILTTHESNLLDQDIFRTDEIWFAEKNKFGATKMYSLASYKEHSTIDIRKGYLNGRYGAIPFTGNLRDLNWHKDVEQK